MLSPLIEEMLNCVYVDYFAKKRKLKTVEEYFSTPTYFDSIEEQKYEIDNVSTGI